MLRRALWLASAAFAVVGLWLMLAYQADRQLLARTAREADGGPAPTPAERLERYVRFANQSIRNPRYEDLHPLSVKLYYRFSPFHPGPGDVLRWGGDYRGSCGSHVRVVVAMLQSAGIPAHHLQILDTRGHAIHSVVQAEIGGRWVVADALYGIVYRRRDGALATAEDLNLDRPNFRAQVQGVRGYDSTNYDFDQVTSFNWNKIPVLLPTLRKVLVVFLGEERVSQIARPDIWMWPQLCYGLACLAVAVGLALAASRRARRPALTGSRTP